MSHQLTRKTTLFILLGFALLVLVAILIKDSQPTQAPDQQHLPLYPGSYDLQTTTGEQPYPSEQHPSNIVQTHHQLFKTADSVDSVFAFYKQTLVKDNWVQDNSRPPGGANVNNIIFYWPSLKAPQFVLMVTVDPVYSNVTSTFEYTNVVVDFWHTLQLSPASTSVTAIPFPEPTR